MSDEAHHFLHPHPHPHPQPPPPSSSMRHRPTSDGCGEIVEVQGGHIVRSTGRKDRHSKVCTAKGTRDRRVRLSAHTAIQFYDVQDRLGVDRPSKAVDWLIKKARTSIDELAQLPPWDPAADAIRSAAANAKPRRTAAKTKISPSPPPLQPQQLQVGGFDGEAEHPSYLPPSMDSDSIADTMKSFFSVVVGSSPEAPPNQDLRLSLHSFQQHHHHHNSVSASVAEPVLFYGQSNPFVYDATTGGWEQQSVQRLVSGATDTPPIPSTTSFQPVLGQSQLYFQRGSLQSSYTPMSHRHHSNSTDDLNNKPSSASSSVSRHW